MPRCNWLRCLCVLLLLWPTPSVAFTQKGHSSIERAAYEQLLNDEQGVLALQKLVAIGILRPPVSLDQPDAFQGLRLLSDLPDNSVERQLQSYGQCFHFMARSSDFTSSNGMISDMPERAVVDAYLRCMNLVDTLFRAILYDPAESQDRKLDIYVLMHIVTDAFSEAHVMRKFERDETYDQCTARKKLRKDLNCSGKIAYLTSWRLRSALPYIVHPAAWKFYFNESHHGIFESRDDGYAVDTPECQSKPNRNFVESRCLADPGRRAAAALAHLLRLLANHADCTGFVDHHAKLPIAPEVATRNAHLQQCMGLDSDLSNFYATHFSHVLDGQKLPDGSQLSVSLETAAHLRGHQGDVLFPASRIEAEPLRDLGVGVSLDLAADEPVWLTARLFGLRNAMDSETLGIADLTLMTFEFRLPLEDSSGHRQLGAAFEQGLKLPIDLFNTPNYGLLFSAHARLEYTVSPIADGLARHRIAVGFGGAALDLTVLNRLWFGAQGPRCMFEYDSWLNGWNNRACYWGVKAGGTFGAF